FSKDAPDEQPTERSQLVDSRAKRGILVGRREEQSTNSRLYQERVMATDGAMVPERVMAAWRR
uniref:hypothetical protein n=1 Tax=Stenotrophomonas maltophilia TaxID=40324 RepID=UPI001FA77610